MYFQAITLAMIIAASSSGNSVVAGEPSKLDGTWLEIIEERPRIGYGQKANPMTVVIDGSVVINKHGDRTVRQSLFVLPANQGDGAVDFTTVVDGEFWHTKGLCKIEGDVLTISESTRDGERPKDFRKSDLLSNQLVLVRSFRRVKANARDESSPIDQGLKAK